MGKSDRAVRFHFLRIYVGVLRTQGQIWTGTDEKNVSSQAETVNDSQKHGKQRHGRFE